MQAVVVVSARRRLATLAALLLTVAPTAAAQRPGVAARLELGTPGSPRTLEIWRDDATGELALRDPAAPENALRVPRARRAPDGVRRRSERHRRAVHGARAPLRGAQRERPRDLAAIEAALTGGAPAPDPAWYRDSLRAEHRPVTTSTILDFGDDVRAAARALGRPVAWAGPRAAGLPIVAAQIVSGRDRLDRGPAPAPQPYVVYGGPDVPLLAAAYLGSSRTTRRGRWA